MGVEVELDSNSTIPPRWAQAGTLDDWREAMAEIAAADRTAANDPLASGRLPHVIIGILMGLAGPLAQLIRVKTWGVILSGAPGSGKTIALLYAGGIWGSVHESAPNSAVRTMGTTLAGARNSPLSARAQCSVWTRRVSRGRSPNSLNCSAKFSSDPGDIRHGQASQPTTWSTLVLVSAGVPSGHLWRGVAVPTRRVSIADLI